VLRRIKLAKGVLSDIVGLKRIVYYEDFGEDGLGRGYTDQGINGYFDKTI